MSYKQIVWIASYPKSGNTWVRAFIDAYFLGEVDINQMVCSVSDDTSTRYQVGDGSDIRLEPVDIQMLARPMAMLRLVKLYNANKIDGVPLFVKTHSAHMIANGIEQLPEMLTKATVFIVRDPRDVLPSFAAHMGISLDEAIDAMSDRYRVLFAGQKQAKCAELISSWLQNTESFINADSHNVMVIKYEDMLADPCKEMARILRHSGIEPDMDRVKTAVEMVSLANLKKQEEKAGFNEGSPYADAFFGGKKEKPTDIQLHRIKKLFEKPMRKLGYLNEKRARA